MRIAGRKHARIIREPAACGLFCVWSAAMMKKKQDKGGYGKGGKKKCLA